MNGRYTTFPRIDSSSSSHYHCCCCCCCCSCVLMVLLGCGFYWLPPLPAAQPVPLMLAGSDCSMPAAPRPSLRLAFCWNPPTGAIGAGTGAAVHEAAGWGWGSLTVHDWHRPKKGYFHQPRTTPQGLNITYIHILLIPQGKKRHLYRVLSLRYGR